MADKRLINKIKRQRTLTGDEKADMLEYDKIVDMEWDGIPGLADKEYYVEYRDTTGRDVMQQATSVFAVQRPEWNIQPRGIKDLDRAEEYERIIEWYMAKAAQFGRKPFFSEAMTHIAKYNKVCSQLEWDDTYFCVKTYYPGSVDYEMGSKLQWVSVTNNVSAVSILEHWDGYAKPGWVEKLTKGDDIGKALKKIQALVDDDEEQRMMYVDYTDDKRRYVYCYPVSDEAIDEDLGYDDDGVENKDLIVIQDKENTLGFINWAISENEGDPLLAPLLKGKYYDNINDLMTMKATTLFRRGLFPMFIQQGRADEAPQVDYGDADTIIPPQGAALTQITPPPLDPGYDAMEFQMRQRMANSMGIQNVSQTNVSNVQNATLNSQIELWLMQYEPNKRTAERHYEKLAMLMLLWAKKKNKVLKAFRKYGKGEGKKRGQELLLSPDDIELDMFNIECVILGNNPNSRIQIANEINMLKQAGLHFDEAEYIARLGIGDPDMQKTLYEKGRLRDAVLESVLKEVLMQPDMKMADFQAMLQVKVNKAMADFQMQQAQQQQQQGVEMQGQEPAQQGMPLPSDAALSGQGFNAGQGGVAPQAVNPITREMR